MASRPRVTVITGNSNSGSACIRELFEKYPNKLTVRAAFRSKEKAKPFEEKYSDLEVVVDVDASKPETLVNAFKDSQYALIVTTHDPTKGFGDDAKLTENMINSAVENGVGYIVLVASWTVKDVEKMKGISERFKPSELLLERLGNEKNLKWTVLRGGCFMENILDQIEQIKVNSVLRQPKSFVPVVDTRDIGKSAAACLASNNIDEHNHKYYEINGPEVLTGEDMARIFSKVLGREIKYVETPRNVLRQIMPGPVAEIFEYIVDNGRDAVPFTDDVKRLTGQNGTFEQFLRDHLNIH